MTTYATGRIERFDMATHTIHARSLRVSRLVVAALLASAMLAGSTLPARAEENSPAKTIAVFYAWYFHHQGRIERIWGEARQLFADDLFDGLESTYFKGGSIALCPRGRDEAACAPERFDPFANASVPATSYTIGALRTRKSQVAVDVSLRLADKGSSRRHVTVLLHDNGRWYVIDNLLYAEAFYSYGQPIVDLTKFLGNYNC
jgi:hypothetical protein